MGVQEKPDVIDIIEKIIVVWPCQQNARTKIT